MSFPWRKYSNNELIEDFEKLKKNINKDNIKNSKIKKILTGYKSSNNFFQKERMKTPLLNKQSCEKFWGKKKDYIRSYKKKSKKKDDLFSVISFLNFCPAQFQPYAAGMVYKYFNAKKVFDPYAGWGDRCIAAMAMNINYIGCDSNIHLENCYEKMINFFDKYSDSAIELYFGKTEDMFKEIPKGTDLLFTSPPFFDEKGGKVEKYNNFNDNFIDFMTKSLIPIIKMALKAKIPVCLYIPENMYNYLNNFFGECTEKILLPNRGAHKKDNVKTTKSKSNIIYCWF